MIGEKRSCRSCHSVSWSYPSYLAAGYICIYDAISTGPGTQTQRVQGTLWLPQQSGNCTHCGKYIQMALGKHIAFYHLELAQLWRCPVMWCTVWKGTAQDCIDHMRRTHMLPLSVKAANLTKYFPAWTVTRDQWSKMLMSCVSGVAIDTLLFSRVGSPLCHRYRLITGSHTAFRGTYLKRLRHFIEESDDAVRRQLHRQPTQGRSARVVKSTDNPASGPLRPPVGHKIYLGPDDRIASKELQLWPGGRSLVNAPPRICLPYRR